jgi:hypothetical protein
VNRAEIDLTMAAPNSVDSSASDGDNGRSGTADGEGADESGGAWPESKGVRREATAAAE